METVEKRVCEWMGHEVADDEELVFVENYSFSGHVCEECKQHEIHS